MRSEELSGKNIVLTGFMGTGKSSVGRRLAKKLGLKFVDTDDLITAKARMSVKEIFDQFGEPKFREIERDVVARVSGEKGLVIATGGGVVLDEGNMDNLQRTGIIICLTASPEDILARTGGRNERPLLNTDEREKKVRDMLEHRRAFYARADLSIDTSSLNQREVIEKILEYLNETTGN